jgi:RNA polymerase sigma factor FliA
VAKIPDDPHPSQRSDRQLPTDPLTAEQAGLVVEHLPIVRSMARRIQERLPQHIRVEDLYRAGLVGLLNAARRFDASKQVTFRRYAQSSVRAAVLDSLRALDWPPRRLLPKARAIEQAMRTLMAQLGRFPNDLEIAHQLSIDLASYRQLLGELKGLEIGTLHSQRAEDSGEEELAYLPNRSEDDPLFLYLPSELLELLAEVVRGLPQRERLVVTLYYYEEASMKEIGLIMGVAQSRISQILVSAVLRLRSQLSVPITAEESRRDGEGQNRIRIRRTRNRSGGFSQRAPG